MPYAPVHCSAEKWRTRLRFDARVQKLLQQHHVTINTPQPAVERVQALADISRSELL